MTNRFVFETDDAALAGRIFTLMGGSAAPAAYPPGNSQPPGAPPPAPAPPMSQAPPPMAAPAPQAPQPAPAPMAAPAPAPAPAPAAPPASSPTNSAQGTVLSAMQTYARTHKAAGAKAVLAKCGLTQVSAATPEQLAWLLQYFQSNTAP